MGSGFRGSGFAGCRTLNPEPRTNPEPGTRNTEPDQNTSRSCALTTLPSYEERTSFSSSSSVELQINW
jgi:hypothetical protein